MSNATLTQQALVVALSSVFAEAVYPNIAPDQAVAPFAVYSRITHIPQTTLADGAPLVNSHYQVDVYATNYTQAQDLAAAAAFAMLGIGKPIDVLDPESIDAYDSDVKLHRVIQNYSIWQPRSIP